MAASNAQQSAIGTSGKGAEGRAGGQAGSPDDDGVLCCQLLMGPPVVAERKREHKDCTAQPHEHKQHQEQPRQLREDRVLQPSMPSQISIHRVGERCR